MLEAPASVPIAVLVVVVRAPIEPQPQPPTTPHMSCPARHGTAGDNGGHALCGAPVLLEERKGRGEGLGCTWVALLGACHLRGINIASSERVVHVRGDAALLGGAPGPRVHDVTRTPPALVPVQELLFMSSKAIFEPPKAIR